MKPLRPFSAAPTRVASGLARERRWTALPLVALAGLIAACGGSDGGPSGPDATQTSVRIEVAASASLAPGTTGVSVRLAPSYERASGERVALAAQTLTYTPGAAQTLPITVDLAACFNDAARRGADQGTGANAVCVVGGAVTLVSSGRTLDSTFVGPFTVRGGATTAVAVNFVEVASVRVTREGGAAIGTQPVGLAVGQTLDLAATPLDATGAGVVRPVAWTSTAASVATVDPATGIVTATGFGSARIVAASGGRETGVDIVVQPALTVTTAGAGLGTVTSSPAGINCTGAAVTCSASFATGTAVTLTATPDANSTFTGWSGACTGTGPCAVTLDQARAVTATFGRRTVTLNVNVTGVGTDTVLVTGTGVTGGLCAVSAAQPQRSCVVTAEAGRTVTITARPGSGSAAGTWSGACTGAATQACSLTPTADATLGVTFSAAPAPATTDSVLVSVLSSDGTALEGTLSFQGTLNGRPIGSLFAITLRTSAAQPSFVVVVDRGSPVTVNFQGNAPATVQAWGGACAGTTVTTPIATCNVTSTQRTVISVTLRP